MMRPLRDVAQELGYEHGRLDRILSRRLQPVRRVGEAIEHDREKKPEMSQTPDLMVGTARRFWQGNRVPCESGACWRNLHGCSVAHPACLGIQVLDTSPEPARVVNSVLIPKDRRFRRQRQGGLHHAVNGQADFDIPVGEIASDTYSSASQLPRICLHGARRGQKVRI